MDYTAARDAITNNPSYNDNTKSYLLSEIDKREQMDTQNQSVPAGIRAVTPPLNEPIAPAPYGVSAPTQKEPVMNQGVGGAGSSGGNMKDDGLLSSNQSQPSSSVNNEPIVNYSQPVEQSNQPAVNQTQTVATNVQTPVPAKPVTSVSGGMGAANPLQTGLTKNLTDYETTLFGKEGNSSNLSTEEQARLDQIDAMEANKSITPEKANLYRESVKKGAIARTKVTGTFERAEVNLKNTANLESKFQADSAKMMGEANNEVAKQEALNQASELKRNEELKKKDEDINNFIKTAPIYKEDANRYWNSMGTGGKTGFGIAALIAGAASGFVGRKSNAFDQLNQNIDRDIAAQRKTYEAANDKFKNQLLGMNQSYARAYQIAGNEKDAGLLIRAQRLDKMQRDLGLLAQTTGSDRTKLAAEAASIKLANEIAKTMMELKNSKLGLQYPQKGGSGSANAAAPTKIVENISGALEKVENYNQAATDILSLASGGDINLNPGALSKVGSWFKGIGSSDLGKQEAEFGKDGAAILRRVEQVVTDNPVTGEHSDKDRESAIKVIVGEGDPKKIVERLQQRAQRNAKDAQRQAGGLTSKQQQHVEETVLPASAPQYKPTLSNNRE